MYSLQLMQLHRLVELRAAEGFQAVALRVGVKPGGGKATSSRRRASRISDANVLIRMARPLHRSLLIEYTLEYAPLVSVASLGAVTVTIDIVGDMDLVRALKDPQARAAGDMRQALRRFLRGLQEVDFGLFRVVGLLKPNKHQHHPSSGPREREGEGGAPGGAHSHGGKSSAARVDLLWLGHMPVQEWTRWLKVEYMEVLTLGGQEAVLGEGYGEDWASQRAMDEGAREGEEQLVAAIGRWSSHQASRAVFWRMVQREGGAAEAGGTRDGTESLGFCLLRVVWASAYVARICVGFFGLGPVAQRDQVCV
jgi:hypothetical protein